MTTCRRLNQMCCRQAHYVRRWDTWAWTLWVYSWKFKLNFLFTFPLINLRNFPSCIESEISAHLISSLNQINPFHLFTTCLRKNNLHITPLLCLPYKYSYYLACRHFEYKTKFIFTQCVLRYSPIIFLLIHSYGAVRQWTHYFSSFTPINVQAHESFHPYPRVYRDLSSFVFMEEHWCTLFSGFT
jgi:hypothetical protein